MFICHSNHLTSVLPSANLDRLVTQGHKQQTVLQNDPQHLSALYSDGRGHLPVSDTGHELQDKNRAAIYANLKIHLFLHWMKKTSLQLIA